MLEYVNRGLSHTQTLLWLSDKQRRVAEVLPCSQCYSGCSSPNLGVRNAEKWGVAPRGVLSHPMTRLSLLLESMAIQIFPIESLFFFF